MGEKKKLKKAEEKARAKALARTKKITEDARSSKKKSKKATSSFLEGPAKEWTTDPREALSVGPDFTFSGFERDATPGWNGSEKEGLKALKERGADFAELQERLYASSKAGGYASSKAGGHDSVLLIVQGLDTAGKGGIVRHVVSQVDPQGIALTAFKAPTEQERAHDFLWRVRPRLPRPGFIGVFDRSHYEDLLVPTAQARIGAESIYSVSEDELNRRYHDIDEMEASAIHEGMRIIKVCLVVSFKEQGERLAERLERPDKHWKFSMGDLDTRDHWEDFQKAYFEVISRTSTELAPWYVIPADKKWYARLAVQELVVRTLEDIDPRWPEADFNVEEAKRRLALTTSPEALLAHSDEHITSTNPSKKKTKKIAVDAMGPVTKSQD